MRMRIRQLLALALFLLVLHNGLYAQRWWDDFAYPRKHNLYVSLNGGVGSLLINGNPAPPTTYNWTSGFEINYTKLFQDYWGIQIGISPLVLNGAFSEDSIDCGFLNYITITDGQNSHSERAEFVYRTNNVREDYRMTLIEIPLRVTYVNEHWSFAGGLKLGIPISVTSHYSYGQGEIGIASVPGTGTELEEILIIDTYEAKEGDYEVCSITNDKIGKILFGALSLDCGYRISLKGTSSLQLGLYADYALNQIHAGCEGNDDFISFPNGIPTMTNCMQSNLISGFNYLNAGMKLTYQLGGAVRVGEHKLRYHPTVRYSNSLSSYLRKLKMRKLRRRSRFKLF